MYLKYFRNQFATDYSITFRSGWHSHRLHRQPHVYFIENRKTIFVHVIF